MSEWLGHCENTNLAGNGGLYLAFTISRAVVIVCDYLLKENYTFSITTQNAVLHYNHQSFHHFCNFFDKAL